MYYVPFNRIINVSSVHGPNMVGTTYGSRWVLTVILVTVDKQRSRVLVLTVRSVVWARNRRKKKLFVTLSCVRKFWFTLVSIQRPIKTKKINKNIASRSYSTHETMFYLDTFTRTSDLNDFLVSQDIKGRYYICMSLLDHRCRQLLFTSHQTTWFKIILNKSIWNHRGHRYLKFKIIEGTDTTS